MNGGAVKITDVTLVSPKKSAFTLIEIMVVLVIMGFLVALVAPKYAGVVDDAKEKLNKSQMQMIKRASLDFYKDVGFVPDNVSLLIYPFENCDVNDSNWNLNGSEVCKNMISFIDRHYKFSDATIRLGEYDEGDNGKGTVRKGDILIEIIKEKLNPKKGGWRGAYLGGNGFLKSKNIKVLGTDGASGYENTNRYYFSDQDIKIYYDGYGHDENETLHQVDDIINWTRDKANKELYPVYSADFNGTQNRANTSRFIQMDAWYENARYRKYLSNSLTVLDSFGTPFEIQIPTEAAVGSGELRSKYARIVSFGKDRRRDTDINVLNINYSADGYDDSVLYIFENNMTSYFHPKDKE